MFPNLAAQKTCVAETNFAARKTKNAFASRAQILRPKHMVPSLATPRNIKRNIVSATIGPFIREKIRRACLIAGNFFFGVAVFIAKLSSFSINDGNSNDNTLN